MVVKVCDAIMGSGKSSATITFINEHPDAHIVYITPYLEEARRIYDGCPDAGFVEPSDKRVEFNFSKLEHTRYLLANGVNISTTHAAFRSYTEDMIVNIRRYNYVLIIDEAVDVFQEAKYSDEDVQLMIDGGYAVVENGIIKSSGVEYCGTRMKDLFEMLRCNNLIQVDRAARGVQYYYWSVPADILNSFGNVFVLTYLFYAQEFKYFLDINRVQYEYIGISYDGDTYRFSERPDYVPAYVRNLKDKIHIFDNDKMNAVGKNRCALSANWMRTHSSEKEDLKKNVYNYFRYYNSDSRCDDLMWSTYAGSKNSLRGRGYTNQWVAFNTKASNAYKERSILAYCVNIFASPQKVKFFEDNGVSYDEDGYAISTMIQWIWRSAIRDGYDINIYIPSKRMRDLLISWIETVSGGDNNN